jgi:diketogulonate reductase-like aldo/keto reductase
VNAIAKAHNKSSAQVALRWVVQQDIVVVTETDKLAHELDDLALWDWRLTEGEMAKLAALV